MKSRQMRWVRHVACVGAAGIVYKVLVRKPEELTWKTRCKWEDNGMDLKEIGWEYVNWIHVAQDKS
jgi:hypothetical protein